MSILWIINFVYICIYIYINRYNIIIAGVSRTISISNKTLDLLLHSFYGNKSRGPSKPTKTFFWSDEPYGAFKYKMSFLRGSNNILVTLLSTSLGELILKCHLTLTSKLGFDFKLYIRISSFTGMIYCNL